ncbi:quinone oxidoreductase [Ascosphaera apis ARSEF 7405]|uniref:Probable quinone oxidoreductase n=1 Tax=Ascosphaera apis ARSEF 7405 TaxID=392613 RepID=A0A167X125_9EURO|nr:quinone oxidoreductase [Ascosphaera apis ARSEF 7405]
MSPIPQTMRGVVVHEVGGPEVLEHRTDLPVPSPGEGQVLIKNSLAGVNFLDIYFRTGLYSSQMPFVPGQEGIGTVVAVGPGESSSKFKIDDRVVYIGSGTYAEYSTAFVKYVAKVPDGIDEKTVLVAFLSGLTTLSFVEEAYTIKPGDWALLHAAAGGAGVLMTQLLKLSGARVIATAGGPDKCKLVKSLGADVVIDYRAENWVARVMEATNGQGVEVVYDSVAKDTWEGSLKVAKRKGTVVFFGNASGPVPPLSIEILRMKNLKLLRPTLYNYIATEEEFNHYTTKLFNLLATGQLKTFLQKVYPLEEIQQVHRDLEGRRTTGKILVKP